VKTAAILAGVEEVAREHVGLTVALEPGQRLVDDLELDSLKALTLAVEIENRFQIRLSPEREAAIETVGDLVDAIAEELADAGR
jgi:acyl carrier protein